MIKPADEVVAAIVSIETILLRLVLNSLNFAAALFFFFYAREKLKSPLLASRFRSKSEGLANRGKNVNFPKRSSQFWAHLRHTLTSLQRGLDQR